IKAVPGETVTVTADIFRDGHEQCEADILYRRADGDGTWRREPMRFVDNDGWAGSFAPDAIGLWEYTIEARTKRRPGDEPYVKFETPCRYAPVATLRVDPKAAEFAAWYEMF